MSSLLATAAPWDRVASAYARHIAPHLAWYADDALAWADVRAGERVVDVAAGPGTLSLRAAALGAEVEAIDVSPRMVECLAARGPHAVRARVGDGAALPYSDGHFDAGFSMFGLMFFADRGRGFRELLRVLRPGGRAVVSSWGPLAAVPFYAQAFAAVRAVVPELPPPPPALPLGDPATARAEMGAAGFVDVKVREVVHTAVAPSVRHYWSDVQASSVPFTMLAQHLGPTRWAAVAAHVEAALVAHFGEGVHAVPQAAYLALGRRQA